MRRRPDHVRSIRSEMFIDRPAPEFLSFFRSVIFVALLKKISKELFGTRFYKHRAPNGAQNFFSLILEIARPFGPRVSICSAEPVHGSAMRGAERGYIREPPR